MINNRQEILDKIISLKQELQKIEKYLNKIVSKSAEERMTEIWRSCNNVKYSLDNCRTYFKNNEPMFQQDWINNKLYYRYSLVYIIFVKKYNMIESDINKLVIKVLSKDLNCTNLEARLEGTRWGYFLETRE
jgi:serine protease inhibitor